MIVPLFDWTCRNLGVLANAQTRRVQSDDQSGRYSAPISNAWERSVLRSGFTNPDNTKTTPSCPKIQNHLSNIHVQNTDHPTVSRGQAKFTKSLEKSGPFGAFWEVPPCFVLPESSTPSLEPAQEGRLLLDAGPDIFQKIEFEPHLRSNPIDSTEIHRTYHTC